MGDQNNGRYPWQKNEKIKAAEYARDLEATRNLPYEEKFAGFINLCNTAADRSFQIVIVAFPAVLGDDYDEVLKNLTLAAKARLMVAFAGGGE